MENRSAPSFEVNLPGGQNRLRELTLYVCKKCEASDRFGKVKLNKVLWRADFESFRERQTPVTGRSYQKLAAGPAPLEMPLVLREMEAQGKLSFRVTDYGNGYVEERPCALVDPDLSQFSVDDIGFVDESIQFYWFKTASNASALSHKVAWRGRLFLDLIPYESVCLSDEKMDFAGKQRFAEMAKSKGWMSQ